MGIDRFHVKSVTFIFHNGCNRFFVKRESDIIYLILMLQILQRFVTHYHVPRFSQIDRILYQLRIPPAQSSSEAVTGTVLPSMTFKTIVLLPSEST